MSELSDSGQDPGATSAEAEPVIDPVDLTGDQRTEYNHAWMAKEREDPAAFHASAEAEEVRRVQRAWKEKDGQRRGVGGGALAGAQARASLNQGLHSGF